MSQSSASVVGLGEARLSSMGAHAGDPEEKDDDGAASVLTFPGASKDTVRRRQGRKAKKVGTALFAHNTTDVGIQTEGTVALSSVQGCIDQALAPFATQMAELENQQLQLSEQLSGAARDLERMRSQRDRAQLRVVTLRGRLAELRRRARSLPPDQAHWMLGDLNSSCSSSGGSDDSCLSRSSFSGSASEEEEEVEDVAEEVFDDVDGADISVEEGACADDSPGVPRDGGLLCKRLQCYPGTEFLTFPEGQAMRRASRFLARHMLDIRLKSNLCWRRSRGFGTKADDFAHTFLGRHFKCCPFFG